MHAVPTHWHRLVPRIAGALLIVVTGCGNATIIGAFDLGPASQTDGVPLAFGDATAADTWPTGNDAGGGTKPPAPDLGSPTGKGEPNGNGKAGGKGGTGSTGGDGTPTGGCYATVCFAGAVTRNDSVNPELAQVCGTLPGLVQACNGSTCFALFEMFELQAAHAALIAQLDANGDGRYDDQDPACEVRIVGYSWGGVNAVDLARAFIEDSRVAPSRKTVHKLIALDPYQPLASLRVVAGVQHFWEYRHSIAPAADCSRGAILGPYMGLAPSCHTSVQTCLDYDYSLAPGTVFGGYPGNQVGHCTTVRAAREALIYNLASGQAFQTVPPTVPANRFD